MSKLEPKYILFDSLVQMLAPETLSELLSKPIARVDRQPMNGHLGVAGGQLSYVDTNAGRLVLKQMSSASDWIMFASGDEQCRAVRLWQYGLLDQLRPHLEHEIVACSRDNTGWAILMHDQVVVDGVTHYARFDVAEYLMIPKVAGARELAIFCSAIVGAGIGFLWYNTLPAQVFMGDVGSLGLGGALGTVAVLTKNELLSALILGIFVVEALSVLIQRYYFKATKKRIFLMAPIHHHFEKKHWSEAQIVVRFWIISILLCLVALASLKLR